MDMRFMFVLLIAQGNWSNCSEKWRLETLGALSIKEKRRRETRGGKSKEEEKDKEREKKMQLREKITRMGCPEKVS